MNIDALDIRPTSLESTWLTARLSDKLTVGQITSLIGFKPNAVDDPSKVTASWAFTVNGQSCAVWDYKGSRWSAFGPVEALRAVFGDVVSAP